MGNLDRDKDSGGGNPVPNPKNIPVSQGLLHILPVAGSLRTGWPWTEESVPPADGQGPEWPKITLVTPSLNQGQFIEETIRSVLLQNYPNLEYIIIDGGSSDQTPEIIRKYARWLSYWTSEPDKGQSHALNKGLERSTGLIWNWLNADDVLAEGALLHIGSLFLRNSCRIVCGYTTFHNVNTGLRESTYRLYTGNTAEEAFANDVMNQPGTYFLREDVVRLGGLNENMHYTFDLELWLRFVACYGIDKIALTDKEICIFKLHDASKSVRAAPLFKQEIDGMRLYLAGLLGAPRWYFRQLEAGNPGGISYLPAKWQFSHGFDRRKLWSAVITEHLYHLYHTGNKTAARNGLLACLPLLSGNPKVRLIKLYLNAFILPAALQRLFRRIRRRYGRKH